MLILPPKCNYRYPHSYNIQFQRYYNTNTVYILLFLEWTQVLFISTNPARLGDIGIGLQ